MKSIEHSACAMHCSKNMGWMASWVVSRIEQIFQYFFFWKYMPPQRVEKEYSALQIRYGTHAKGTGPLERVGTEGTDEVSDSL